MISIKTVRPFVYGAVHCVAHCIIFNSVHICTSLILILFIFKKSICRLTLTDTQRVSVRDLDGSV